MRSFLMWLGLFLFWCASGAVYEWQRPRDPCACSDGGQ